MPAILSRCIDVQCHVAGHTWHESCTRSTADIFINCMKYALSVYTPLYTVTALLNKKGKQYFMEKLVKEILQSSLFLSSNGLLMVFFFCLLRKLFGGFYAWSAGFLPGCLSSFCAILIERKSRRGALAVYMLNQAFDTVFSMMKHAGLASEIKFGEVIIFSAAVSALMLMYRTDNMPDGFIKSIIKKMDVKEFRRTSIVSKYTPDYLVNTELSFKLSAKAFLAGYGIQMAYSLLTNISKLMKKPGVLVNMLISKDHLQLGAFFGSLVLLYNITEIILQKSNKNKIVANAVISGAVAGCSMFFQRSSYISLYILSKTLELFYMNGIDKGAFPYVKHFDTMLYTICTGLMFHAAIIQPIYLKPTYWNFLLKLTGKRFSDIDRSYWDAFGYDSSLKPVIVKKKN